MLGHSDALKLMGQLIHYTVKDSDPKVGYVQAVLMDMEGKKEIKIENEVYLLSDVTVIKTS
jgi:hypothetical protein